MNIIENNFKWNGTLSKRSSTTQIILHHADASNCSVEDVHRWHLNNGWAGVGYHYFVRKDGTIYRGRPENTIGAHAINANGNSIGICAEGNYESDTMPEAQKNAIKGLIADIRSRYGNLEVKGHKEVTATSCPGSNYPLEELKSGQAFENNNNNSNEEVISFMKKFRNGSTMEPVYAEPSHRNKIGYLNIGEVCDCFGIISGAPVVSYKVDGANTYKVGFAVDTRCVKDN